MRKRVSILVFVDLALEGMALMLWTPIANMVSILVFVDLALEVTSTRSSSANARVSILVFVDLALEDRYLRRRETMYPGFNPCFRGSSSRSQSGAQMAMDAIRFQSLFSWI